jgi:hypothetical protein
MSDDREPTCTCDVHHRGIEQIVEQYWDDTNLTAQAFLFFAALRDSTCCPVQALFLIEIIRCSILQGMRQREKNVALVDQIEQTLHSEAFVRCQRAMFDETSPGGSA